MIAYARSRGQQVHYLTERAGLGPAAGDQRLDARADALAQAGRVGLAVYQFRFSHLAPQSPLSIP